MENIDLLDYNQLEEWLQEQIEKERQRINQDAHDKVYNRLAALAGMAENAIDSDKIPRETLKHLQKSLREINAELHNIVNAKSESEKSSINQQMVSQLMHMCRNHAITYNQELQLTCWPENEFNFNPKEYWHIECILQECLNNIGKHSEAKNIEMSIETDDKYYVFKVKDNGKGLGKEVEDLTSRQGLKGIYKRAQSLGGHLNIDSSSKGTNITLKIPQAN